MAQTLGIQPTAGGFTKIDIRPDLLGLKWAKGSEPTPHGLLSVGIYNSHGYVALIGLPKGITACVSVPVPSSPAKVLVTGKVAKSILSEGGRRAIVVLSGRGRFVIRLDERSWVL